MKDIDVLEFQLYYDWVLIRKAPRLFQTVKKLTSLDTQPIARWRKPSFDHLLTWKDHTIKEINIDEAQPTLSSSTSTHFLVEKTLSANPICNQRSNKATN